MPCRALVKVGRQSVKAISAKKPHRFPTPIPSQRQTTNGNRSSKTASWLVPDHSARVGKVCTGNKKRPRHHQPHCIRRQRVVSVNASNLPSADTSLGTEEQKLTIFSQPVFAERPGDLKQPTVNETGGKGKEEKGRKIDGGRVETQKHNKLGLSAQTASVGMHTDRCPAISSFGTASGQRKN